MRKRGRREGLLALNGVLVVVLAGLTFSGEPGQAQGQPARARGAYLMVGGETTGGSSNAVYLLDSANEELIAVRWETSNKTLGRLGFRDLHADASRPRSTGPR